MPAGRWEAETMGIDWTRATRYFFLADFIVDLHCFNCFHFGRAFFLEIFEELLAEFFKIV